MKSVVSRFLAIDEDAATLAAFDAIEEVELRK